MPGLCRVPGQSRKPGSPLRRNSVRRLTIWLATVAAGCGVLAIGPNWPVRAADRPGTASTTSAARDRAEQAPRTLASGTSGAVAELPAKLRYPVALATATDRLYAGCSRSGTVSVVDTRRNQVLGEVEVGQRLADLVILPDQRHLLAVDEAAHQVILLQRNDMPTVHSASSPEPLLQPAPLLQVVQRLRIPGSPVRVILCGNGRMAAVASLWARRLTLLRLNTGQPVTTQSATDSGPVSRTAVSPVLSVDSVIDLPFAPRMMTLANRPPVEAMRPGEDPATVRRQRKPPKSPGYTAAADSPVGGYGLEASDRADGTAGDSSAAAPAAAVGSSVARSRWLIAADAFGGRLAVIDLSQRAIARELTIHAGNIRGMCVSRDGNQLLLTHSMLNSQQSTTHDGVFWGNVLSNVLRSMPLARLFQHPHSPSDVNDTMPLGHPSSGTGDPGEVLVTAAGQTVITLSGVGEVSVQPTSTEPFTRRQVGRRPTALAASSDGRHVYVANTHGDSITVLVAPRMKPVATITLGRQPELEAFDRGERLFYDARLSLDGWFSCHSCHTDGHTISQLNDNFSDGAFGSSKRVLSLGGVGQSGPWAWNGEVDQLNTQISKSVQVTMQGFEPDAEDVADLGVYLRSIEPPPALDVARGTVDQQVAGRGQALFRSLGCVNCHVPPLYTTRGVFDVGLEDEAGHREFNPPSLRGVSQRDALFHDGRAANLSEAIRQVRHQLPRKLTAGEERALLAFLRSL